MSVRAEGSEAPSAPVARHAETRRNLVANYVNFIVAGLVGLIVNPLLLGAIGTSGFGIWKACQRIIELALSGDGGPPQALKWLIANSRGDGAEKRRLTGAALCAWLHWLPPMIATSAVLAWLLPHLIGGTDGGSVELPALCLILCANSILAGLTAIPAAALTGENKSWLAVLTTTVALLAANAAIVAAAQAGSGLIGMAVAAIVVAFLQLAGTILVARRYLPWWGIGRSTRAEVRDLGRLGAATLVWSWVQKLLLSSELLLLSVLAGAGSVSQYIFTSFAAQFVPQLTLLTTSAFMPRFGQALARGERAQAAQLLRTTAEINLAIVAVAGAAILAFNEAFVGSWAGENQYMGGLPNALIVASAIQIAHLRWHAQLQDAALVMRERSGLAFAGSLAGIAVAALIWWVSGSIAGMFAGIIAGRFFLSLGISRLSGRLIETQSGEGFGSKAKLTAVTITGGFLAGEVLRAEPRFLPLAVVLLPVFAAFSWRFILSADTRGLITDLLPAPWSRG